MGKITQYKIVIPSAPKTNELRAAAFLQENIKLVCGKKLDIVKDTQAPSAMEIVVGHTARETLDAVELPRSREGVWEYVLFLKGQRLYVTGLGVAVDQEPPYDSAYRVLDDGAIGTVMAAYHFVEDILGYNFIYGMYDSFPEDPEIAMPRQYDYSFTREAFRRKRPELFPGAALYSLNCSERLDWNTGSFILKTRQGKLIVIDGGHEEELPRLVACLKHISGQEIPTVTAWLFSHLHGDHCEAYQRLACTEEWKNTLIVKDVYWNFLSREFWTEVSCEAGPYYGTAYDRMMESANSLNTNIHVVQKGDVITVDEISFQVLHVPDAASGFDMDVNDASVVYKMTYDRGQTMLFLGDAEWICDNDLVANCSRELKSDIVQVGHHGCGSVSRRCYERIGAQVYIWQCGQRFWYQDSGEGLNTHNAGAIRHRTFMKELGTKNENIYVTMDTIHSFPLPMPVY